MKVEVIMPPGVLLARIISGSGSGENAKRGDLFLPGEEDPEALHKAEVLALGPDLPGAAQFDIRKGDVVRYSRHAGCREKTSTGEKLITLTKLEVLRIERPAKEEI